MLYLRRKVDAFLDEWKSTPNHKPLIVKGSRQIGKTESIQRFCKSHYENFVFIDFVLEPQYRTIVDDGYEVDTIIRNISLQDPSKKFVPENTVILFDEIQKYPQIATALKSFHLDGRYDVICSGSMLGVNYKKIESNAVGSKTDYQMHGLDFEEYLWAKGYDESFVDSILEHMVSLTPFSNTELQVLENAYMEYRLLGGMPEVVRGFTEQKNYSGSLNTQRQIAADYEEDVRQYAEGLDQTRIMNVYRNVPAQLAKENKKFQISKVAKGARFKDYRGCVEWLEDSGIIIPCYNMEFPELPLNSPYDDTKYKLYFADSGLLISQLEDEAQADLRMNQNFGVYKGALYENFIADALVKQDAPLRYYKKADSTLEIDFFVRSANYLIPLEVKAKNNNSKSLRTIISNDRYEDVSFGIKLVQGNVGYSNRIFTFPAFCAFLLKRYLATGAIERLYEGFSEEGH